MSDDVPKPRRSRKTVVRVKTKPRVAQVPVPASRVELVPARGTKGRGGGPSGEAWHITVEGTSAGVVFINWVDQPPVGPHASIQIFINKASQGRSIGRTAYRMACEASRYETVYARMRKSNLASRRAAQEAGFVEVTYPDHHQVIMVWRGPNRPASPPSEPLTGFPPP